MKLAAENLHVISKSTKDALISRDESYIKELIKKMAKKNPDWIDLNIGPAKSNFAGVMKWLVEILNGITDIPVSFDSTNTGEIKEGIIAAKNPSLCIINSTNADEERLSKVTELSSEFNTNLIALTMKSGTGIPKECDARLELAAEIQAYCESSGIDNKKIYFDPLVLPVCVDQTQASECLNTIRMLKESFEPPVNTIIGLSNVSNGCPKELRKLINRVFLVMAAGCGLDCAIVDIFDDELLRISKMLDTMMPDSNSDEIYISLYNLMQNLDELENLKFDPADEHQTAIYKTAEILLNKKVYSNSYLGIRTDRKCTF